MFTNTTNINMKVTCDKCGYTWNYRGKSRFYATCPMCIRKVKLRIKKRIQKNG